MTQSHTGSFRLLFNLTDGSSDDKIKAAFGEVDLSIRLIERACSGRLIWVFCTDNTSWLLDQEKGVENDFLMISYTAKIPEVTLSIKEQAKQAIMFKDPDKGFLRMQWCGEDFFSCLDEDTGEEYAIEYKDVDLSTCSFYKLEKI